MQFFVVNAPLPSTPTPNNIKCVLVTRLQLLSRDVGIYTTNLDGSVFHNKMPLLAFGLCCSRSGNFLRLFLSLCVEEKSCCPFVDKSYYRIHCYQQSPHLCFHGNLFTSISTIDHLFLFFLRFIGCSPQRLYFLL